jgi:hypothetical protein
VQWLLPLQVTELIAYKVTLHTAPSLSTSPWYSSCPALFLVSPASSPAPVQDHCTWLASFFPTCCHLSWPS